MPRLWRSHDRHRGVRARLRAEVAADTGQDRYVMSQTFCRRCGFPVPMRWLHAGGDLSRTNYIHQPADRPLIRPDRNGYCTLPTSRACRHRGAVVLACRPSRSAPILILHSTPCQPVPNFPRLRALALFGRRPAQSAKRLVVAGVQKPEQQPTSLEHWTRSIHFTKNHSFHVGKDTVVLRQLQQVLLVRSVR
jgi:hypothetical protein